MERNTLGLSSLINSDNDRAINIMDRNNAFANQNLNAIGSSLKDLVINRFANGQTAIERTSAANMEQLTVLEMHYHLQLKEMDQ